MATAKKNGAGSKKAPATKKNKGGRPTKFTKAIADEICTRMASGESLLKITRDKHMPVRMTVYRWLFASDNEGNRIYQEFCDKYEEATNIRADHMFDEIEEIADESENVVRKGSEKKSSAFAQTQRLRIDARKWYLSKIMPKKYSDKSVHVTEDEDGNHRPIVGNVIEFASQNKK